MTYQLPTYNRVDLSVARAAGTIIEDVNGQTFLDFGSGIGVCNLGHRHPAVQQAVENQLNQYWHVSNLYKQPIQEEVAKQLVEHSAGDYVFFCNSGAEANEAAIKLARKATGKKKIITFKQSFHGRTFATMAATGQEKVQTGFGPMLEGFKYVNYNDLAAVEEAVDLGTAAIMLEVIQGEGGVHPGNYSFIQGVEQLCKKHDILLLVDEIQTGIGRTGKAFAYEHYNIAPDIITTAKGLGNGFPVGAMIAKVPLEEHFGPGTHGSTFGGNPLAMAAAKEVLQTIFQAEFLHEVTEKADYLLELLKSQIGKYDSVTAFKGRGMMIGIHCSKDISTLVPKLLANGLIVLNAGPNVIRLLPPLTVSREEMKKAVSILADTWKNES
ncbi:acetylornithine transaminase [Virgibacillus sp. W0181]|uniref:acetylornithine transaminase n=1 Tax=Virgibacillus sp. W0181 TaxID=3391581 RepID=UPI003F479D94